MGILIGYKKGTSQKGKPYCLAQVMSEYNAMQNSNGCVGNVVQDIFIPPHQIDYLEPKMVGKEIKLDYEVNFGKAFLVQVQVVSK